MKNIIAILLVFLAHSIPCQSSASPSTFLNGDNDHLPCPTGFVVDRKNYNDLPDLLQKVNLSPDCIWGTIKKNAERHDVKVEGFSYGTVIEASLGVGVMIGTELVLISNGEGGVYAAIVRIEGGGVGMSLAGASLTQSVIYGDCENSVEKYLGMFKSVGGIAMMNNYGTNGLFGKMTNCNSITSIRGLTSPIIGAGFSFYNLVDGPILIKGPKVDELVKYFQQLNQN